jgi:hypothetical protein
MHEGFDLSHFWQINNDEESRQELELDMENRILSSLAKGFSQKKEVEDGSLQARAFSVIASDQYDSWRQFL